MNYDLKKFKDVTRVGNKWFGFLKLSEAKISKNNIRSLFSNEDLEIIKTQLCPSIKAIDLQQLPVTTTNGDVFIGGRRLKAFEFNNETWLPVEIRDCSPYEQMKSSWAENRARKEVEPLEEAKHFDKMLKEKKLTYRGLATELGISKSFIDDRLNLLKTFGSVRTADKIIEATGTSLDKKRITVAKARQLARDWVPQKVREEVVEKIETEGMTHEEVQRKLGKGKVIQTIIEQEDDPKIQENLEKEFGGTTAFKEDLKVEDVIEKQRFLKGLSPTLMKKIIDINEFTKQALNIQIPKDTMAEIIKYFIDKGGRYIGLKVYVEGEVPRTEVSKDAEKVS